MSVRIPDLPILSAPTDDTLIVADHVGTGVITAAALRDYITVSAGGPYLPADGGTMSGSLSTNATSDITSGRDLYASKHLYVGDGAGGFPWAFFLDGSANRIQDYGSPGYDMISPTGNRSWHNGPETLMSLSADGILSTKTSISSPAMAVTGTLTVGGTITSGAINTSGGALTTGAITATTINASGTVTAGAVSTAGDVTANQLQLGGGFRMLVEGGANRQIYFSAGWALSWAPGTGNLTFIRNGDNAALMSSIGSTGEFVILGANAYKPGGGSWTAPSDSRIKTVVGDYTRGLADVLALQPKRYTYLGNDTITEPEDGASAPYSNSPNYIAAQEGREFVGLVAQDIQASWPEMVSARAGYIDGTAESDILSVDRSDLNLALVNAIKTLEARVAALEAAAARSQTMHHE